MFKAMVFPFHTLLRNTALLLAVLLSVAHAQDAEEVEVPQGPATGKVELTPAYNPHVEPASDEAAERMKDFTVPEGFEIELFAAEPDLANPVCFTVDRHGRF